MGGLGDGLMYFFFIYFGTAATCEILNTLSLEIYLVILFFFIIGFSLKALERGVKRVFLELKIKILKVKSY